MHSPAHTPAAVLLHNIRSMHNVGAFFRTMDAMGAGPLLLSGYTPQPPRVQIAKVSLGAEETVPWQAHATAVDAVRSWQAAGGIALAVELAPGATALEDWAWPQGGTPVLFVFGHEREGVDAELLQLCDGCVQVPMWGSKESLNVSVCGGIVLWAARKAWLVRQ